MESEHRRNPGPSQPKEVFNISVPWIKDLHIREVPCLLCGKRNFAPLNTFILNGKRFCTVGCLEDGMMWLDPQPTEDFYQQLYGEHYHSTGRDDPLFEQATLDVHSDEAKLRQIAILRMDEIEEFVKGGRLLEIGFGSGHVLLEAQSRGWDVFGIEIAQSCAEAMAARGIPTACIPFAQYSPEQEAYDVVAMYGVIEHVLDPSGHLRRAYDLLKQDGILVLRLPDTQEDGPTASLIAHVYHFNQATISTLLSRCGFEVLRIGSFGLWKPSKYPGEMWSMNVVCRKARLPTTLS